MFFFEFQFPTTLQSDEAAKMLKALVERMEAFGKKLEAKTAASKLRKTPAQFGTFSVLLFSYFSQSVILIRSLRSVVR
jgi:hypothetical protein